MASIFFMAKLNRETCLRMGKPLAYSAESLAYSAESFAYSSQSLAYNSESLAYSSQSLAYSSQSLAYNAESLAYSSQSLDYNAESLACNDKSLACIGKTCLRKHITRIESAYSPDIVGKLLSTSPHCPKKYELNPTCIACYKKAFIPSAISWNSAGEKVSFFENCISFIVLVGKR
jgi:hypothetical protein